MTQLQTGGHRSKRRAVATIVTIVAIVAATAIAHVWTHLRVIEYGYRISAATRERDALLERNRRLHVELAMLKSPARVAELTNGPIALRPAEPDQVRRIKLGLSPTPDRQTDDSASASTAISSRQPATRAGSLVAAGPLRLALGASASRASRSGSGDSRQ
jgi:cell division protein FtsL